MSIDNEGGTPLASPPAVTGTLTKASSSAIHDQFTEVVEAHHQHLARMAFLMCDNRQQAEDAVAEAYARVWSHHRRGRVDDLLPYLRQAVVNQIRGGFRRRLIQRREDDKQIVDLRDLASVEPDLDVRGSLAPAVAELPAAQRAVIVLRYYEDLSEEDIAKLLNISVGTVKSRSARALHRLRSLVGEMQ